MIEIKINGVVKWQVNEYTFNDPQMGIRSINMTVKHPSMWVGGTAPDTADFTGAYVDYEGEKYSISSSKPTAEKSNTSLDYIYTLIFKGEEDELTRRKVRNLALVSGDNYVSQGTTFSIYADINQFKQLLENNLKHYFGNKWSINLSILSSDSVRIDVSNVTLWDLLSKTYEYFGVRFNIRGNTINIGYEPEEIYHVFDYGNDGGLVKITKTAPDTSIVNRLSGMGGSRNVPLNYFTDRYSDFAPDPNPINSSVNIRNIMPKVFRDSVVLGDYKDYVEDLASIASHGVREDALAPNEDIYPSIAGVEVSGLGRIDEIIAVSEVIADKPDDENYSPTFHIWVKDIGFNLADEQYTSTQDAKISFTTGALTGYEFTILANGKIREVVEDTTKSLNGVSSRYRITLINSDEDFDATGRVLPNTVLKPSAGDHFVIYDIEMPFSYVANAEQRVQDWLEANLADLKDEKPTFSIEPMSAFFETAPVEFDGKTIKEKLRAGNKITINADTEQKLHINNLTIQYGGLMPKYSFTVTDRVQVQGGTVARLQSQLDGVLSRQALTERDIDTLLSGFSTKYLSKVKPDIAQQFISFLKGISVKDLVYLAEGLEIGNYTSGLLGSGAKFKMNEGISELEVDKLSVRMRAEFFSVLIHQAKHIGGELIISAANMICNKVEEFSSFYRCYFDRGENNEVNNLFTNQDRARCQVFTGTGQKFYWRKVLAVGSDYIELSKTDASPGSNDIPEVGDHIFQLGSDNIDRQSAMIFSSVGADAPSFKQYAGINGYSLVDKETTVFTSKGNRIQGKTVFTSGGSNLDDYLDSTAQDIEDAQAAANAAALKAQQAIEDAEANVVIINTEVGKLQEQLDGEVSNWFYAYSPTLANYPASDWTDNTIKDRHIGDTFTNTAQAPATDAGKSWRFVKNGSTYSWTVIADSDAVKALLEASKAQATADGKSTTHLFQPTKYKLGDMWVLNADLTVNGTAYKQGNLLTATQDSETFVQSHWLKRVRYTDDTAVENLQIGSRNFWLDSERIENIHTGLSFSSRNLTGLVEDGAEMTIQFDIDAPVGYDFRIYKNNTSTVTWGTPSPATVFSKVLTAGKQTIKATFAFDASRPFIVLYRNDQTYRRADVTNLMLGLGNKVTWSEAPEDTQARINSAKQEALTASNTVQTNVNNLSDYVDGSFKNGIIDSAEAKAIEKYLNSLSETKLTLDASYTQVYGNTYLEGTPKSNLETAKTALNTAYTNLINSINTAIADGETTVAEKNDVDAKFGLFNTALVAYQTRLEEASKAIQVKLDNIAKGYVDDLQIGGVNLFEHYEHIKFSGHQGQTITYVNDGDYKDIMKIDNPSYFANIALANIIAPHETSSEYIVSIFARGIGKLRIFTSSGTFVPIVDTAMSSTVYNRYDILIPTLNGLHLNTSGASLAYVAKMQLMRGNKPMDWTSSPNDEQIGTRNLWLGTGSPITRSGGNYSLVSRDLRGLISEGDTCTLQFDLTTTLAYDSIIYSSLYPYISWENMTEIHRQNVPVGKSKYKVTFNYKGIANRPYLIFYKNALTTDTAKFENLTLVKGTKAVWSEAPEDVQARINSAKLTAEQAQLQADGYMRARYVRDWAKGNSTNNNNIWGEIKVINKAGTNLALGKVPTANGVFNVNENAANATDNNLKTYATINNTSNVANYIAIDFGAVNHDIDYIQVWHYDVGGRTFYGTKTEISEDGINWTTIFDSAIEGTYTETAEGKIHSQRWAKVMDRIAETEAKTRFQTLIDGGLIYTALMKLFDTISGDETAFISGKQGAGKNLPAFGAGGSYQDAVAGTAKAIIRHDGTSKFSDTEITGTVNATSGKFTGEVNATRGSIGGMQISGDTIVSENGRLVIDGTNNTIYLLDDNGSIKTVIRPRDIPTSVSSYFSGSLNQNVSFLGIKGTVYGTTTKDSNTIALSGSAYEVTIPPLTLAASTNYTGGVGSSTLSLKLVLSNGGSANDIIVAQVMAISTSAAGYDQVVIPQTKKMITKSGTWRLRLISTASTIGGGTGTNNGSLTSDSSSFNVSEIVNRSEIGSNGMMIATSINNYNFMVGDIFEVRRGNSGLQITNSGIKKWNGTSWVTANI